MSEPIVEKNMVVDLTYWISDDQEEVLERIDLPVSYIHRRNSGLFEKVEAALDRKKVGDEIEVRLSPAEGFGEWNPELSFTDSIENVPPQFRELGAEAQFENGEGDTIKMIVTHVDAGTVTLDGNHPFAGKAVTFHVKIAAIRPATEMELATGQVEQALSGQLH